jgi:hypothetical protein
MIGTVKANHCAMNFEYFSIGIGIGIGIGICISQLLVIFFQYINDNFFSNEH